MMNNEQDDVIGSLNKVLSSVNLAGEVDGSGHSSNGGGQGQQYGAPGTAVGSQTGSWTGLSGSADPSPAPGWVAINLSFSYDVHLMVHLICLLTLFLYFDMHCCSLSYNFYGRSNSTDDNNKRPNSAKSSTNNNEHDSLQNILYDSGIYEKDEVANRRASTGPGVTIGSSGPSTPTPTSSDRERKPSIDIFLSQSPSKTLGEDAFRHMHRTASNPGPMMNMYSNKHNDGISNSSGGIKPISSTAPSSRSESPQTIRSCAGNSPYNNNGGRQMYPSQFQTNVGGGGNNNNFSPTSSGTNQQQQGNLHAQLQQQSSQLSSQFSNSSNNIPGLVNNGQQQQYMAMPVAQQQPQVFYMAVPGPDGKQVLQPMQMVQIPGQAGTIMMPMANGNQGTNDGNVMLMQPSMQGNNAGMNNMYGQDIQGGGSNNQYSQYDNVIQQQSGGYNGYQSKNNFDLGGGQYADPNGNLDQIPSGSLSMLYSSPQRPPLRSLLGNVRRLSRDQVGCRLLQQALDEDGSSAATAILNEGLTFWAEAMVDPFGNYLFQKILERITPEERVTLVSSVSTRLVNASLNLHGTRSVQKIVEVCAADEEESEDEESQDEKDEEEENKKEEEDDTKTKKKGKKKKKETAAKILTDALKPSAARLCIDSHGNHAIQRILLKLPYQYTQFIFDAVATSVEDVARHRHGCCVIQRCLDSRHSPARSHLVTRIVEKSLELMQDAYGNYVVQYVLDVCGDDEVHAICESVIGKVCVLAVQKFSSNVMEKCLERCTDRVREEYLNELNDTNQIRELMMDPFGNYVVQRALSVSTHAQAIRLVETMKPHLSTQNGGGIRNTAGGRRILGKICRRFPNFALEGETFEDYDLNQVLARGSPHHQQGGGRRQNQFGNNYPPGPSPVHRRNNRGGSRNHQHHHPNQHIPQYLQPQQYGLNVNVQQTDMNVMPTYHDQAGASPYLFPHTM